MIRKLRAKFVCFNMLIALLLLAVLFGSQLYYLRLNAVRNQQILLHRIAKTPDGQVRISSHMGESGVVLPYFTLTRSPDGELSFSGSEGVETPDAAELKALYAEVVKKEETDGVLHDRELRYLRAADGSGEKIAFVDISGEINYYRHMLRVNALLTVGALAVLFGLSMLLSKWAIHPVEEAWRQQRNFVADASHELKTPLTVIVSNAELLQQPGYDEAQRRQFSENILTMSRQLRHLTENMLNLARLDSLSDAEKELMELDFSALVESAILPFEPLFFEQGLALETEIEPDVRVSGNERALRQCADILLDNACKYSEPGCVLVRLRRDGHGCTLTVSNPCQELSRAERSEIFRRFYRRDPARSGVSGYGLGLPVAESIIAHHGGKIACDWESGEIRFTVTLPALPPL